MPARRSGRRSPGIHLRALQSSWISRRAPQAEYKDMLAACIERNVRKATTLLQTHIEHTQSALVEQPRRPAFKAA